MPVSTGGCSVDLYGKVVPRRMGAKPSGASCTPCRVGTIRSPIQCGGMKAQKGEVSNTAPATKLAGPSAK